MEILTQAELEAALETLARDQDVNVGVGDSDHRGWFRAKVISHDAAAGRLLVTCFMDHPGDRMLEPGESVIVAAMRMDNAETAPMTVEQCGDGPEPTVILRLAGVWQQDDERRNRIRVPITACATRARRLVGGAWIDLQAVVTDVSSSGLGLSLDHEVCVGDRLSLVVPLGTDGFDLRATLDIRHVHLQPQAESERGAVAQSWHAGGSFRTLSPADHEKLTRFVFAEARSTREPASRHIPVDGPGGAEGDRDDQTQRRDGPVQSVADRM